MFLTYRLEMPVWLATYRKCQVVRLIWLDALGEEK